MEVFAKPGVGGIIIKSEKGIDYILIQEDARRMVDPEKGLIEIQRYNERDLKIYLIF